MVVQIHPWRLSEGEPARRGHPFEAGRATVASLGLESSALFAAPPAARAPVRFTPHCVRGCAIFALPRSVRHWRENRARPGTCWKHVGSAERRLWSMTTSLRHFWRANPESSGVASKANGPAPPVVMRVHRPPPFPHWPVAQKQSSRLISDRHRSITGRANQSLESESLERGDAVLTRSASLSALRGRTSALFTAPPALRAPARLTPHLRSGLRHLRAARSVRHLGLEA